jgi:hypothetical protein
MFTQTRERFIAYALQLPNWFNSFIFCSSGIGLDEMMITFFFFFNLFALQGVNSTTFALSKLTTRLNFLKERRSQLANELQNMDKGQGSAQLVQNLEKGRGSEPRQSLQNPDKVQGIEVQSVQNPDIGEQFDYCTLPGNFGVGTKGQSFANPESFRK